MRYLAAAFVAMFAGATVLPGQVKVVSAPEDDYLLEITQAWAARSPIGDLRERHMDVDGVELRLWGGYGLTGTTGVIIRRQNGRWQGWKAEHVTCPYRVPISVADTASEATVAGFEQAARSSCGRQPPDTLRVASVYEFDSLAVAPLARDAAPAEAWQAAIALGAWELPPKVEREWIMLDGFTYVVEVRRGDAYRASVIEHIDKSTVAADMTVQQVYAAVMERLFPQSGEPGK